MIRSGSSARLPREPLTITGDLADERDAIYFRCVDPDGYQIEVYWE